MIAGVAVTAVSLLFLEAAVHHIKAIRSGGGRAAVGGSLLVLLAASLDVFVAGAGIAAVASGGSASLRFAGAVAAVATGCLTAWNLYRIAVEGEGQPCGCWKGGRRDRFHVGVLVVAFMLAVSAFIATPTEAMPGHRVAAVAAGVVLWRVLRVSFESMSELKVLHDRRVHHFRLLSSLR